jgi:hypothetical protein
MPPDVFARVRARLIKEGWKKGLGGSEALCLLLTVGYFGFAGWLLLGGFGAPARLFAVFFVLQGLFMGFVAATRRYRMPNADERAIQRAFLAEHCCPTCAFSLDSLGTDAGGAVTCPECGSSWAIQTQAS